MYLHDEAETFNDAALVTSQQMDIGLPYIIKDYFTCMFLKEVSRINPNLVFKGGTCLSKCYGIIKRFSEDADLGLEIAKPTEGIRKSMKRSVQEAAARLNLPIANLEETRSRREFNKFILPLPNLILGMDDDQLLVETAVMTPAMPAGMGTIQSFIGESLARQEELEDVASFGLEPFQMKVNSLERTFVDKTFAIADYYLNGDIPLRQSRHVYDLYKLLGAISLDDDMIELFRVVRGQRQGGAKCSSADPTISLINTISEISDKQIYKRDYETVTAPLLYEVISYEEAITALAAITDFLDGRQVF